MLTLLLLPTALALPSPTRLQDLPLGDVQRHPAGVRGPVRAAPPADGWDIEHYDIDLRVDPDARTVEGRITLEATAAEGSTERLVLHADGPLISEVTVDGVSTPWEQLEDEVEIPTVDADDTLTVEITYTVSGDDTTGTYLGLSWGDPVVSFNEPQGARHWLVVRDEPWDKATLTWRLTMPDGWTVVQNGIVTSQDSAEGWTTTISQLDLPLPPYLMVLHAGELEAWRDDSGAVPVELWAAPDTLDAAVTDLGDTGDIIAFFAERWDTYVWPIYRNVIVSFGGGMEHTTATTFGQELLGGDWAGIINAHEIAHHWWGDYLTCASWEEIWLNEGFASHAEARWYEGLYGEEGRKTYFAYQRATYLEWKEYEGVFSLYDPNYMWGGTVYEKGSLVLGMLRELVGPDSFDAALRRYAEDNAHGAVVTADLEQAFTDETGQDWSWYFDQWVYQADDPTYTVGMQQQQLDDGSWQVDLFARQDNDAGSWTMPLEWELMLDDGSSQEARFWVDEAVASVSLCLEAPVMQVELDPQVRLLHAGITRDDGAFSAVPVTCGSQAGQASYQGGGGCGAVGRSSGGLLLGLLSLLGLRRRPHSAGQVPEG